MPGNMAAHKTAKMVMASAERLMEVRHCWRKSSRMAEINVPAWPIPTQKTKFVMSKAQPTLLLRPQTPMPLAMSQVIIPPRFNKAVKAMPKQIHQPLPGLPSSGRAISSVMSWSAGFPFTHRGGCRTSASAPPMVTDLGVNVTVLMRSLRLLRVADLFQISDIRTCSQVFQHLVMTLRPAQLRGLAVGVFQISKHDGFRGASLLASRLDFAIHQLSLALQRNVLGKLDSLHAQAALFHHAPGAHNHIRVQNQAAQRAIHVEIEGVVFGVVVPVEAPHLVRAVVGAVARADAAVVDLLVNAFRTGSSGKHRAHRLARSIGAMLAHHGLVDGHRIFGRAAVVAINTNPMHDADAL